MLLSLYCFVYYRYKCPKCRAPFCCVQCSKDHKANHCVANKSLAESISDAQSTAISNINNSTTAVEQSKYLPSKELIPTTQPKRKRPRHTAEADDSDNDEPGWQITQQMKQQISQSKWIQSELKDGGLRQLIDSIDCASDVEEDDDNSKPHGGYKGQQQKKDNNKISPRVLALARAKHRHPKFASFVDEMLLTAGVLQPAAGGNGGGEGMLANILEGQGGRGPLVLAPVPRRGADDSSVNSESSSSDSDSSEEESDSSEEDSESEGDVKE